MRSGIYSKDTNDGVVSHQDIIGGDYAAYIE